MPQYGRNSLWEQGYRLTYAEIEVVSCAEPDRVRVLLWEDLDQAPHFPVLTSFIETWREQNHARLTSLKVTTLDAITPDMLALRARSLAVH